MIAALNNLSSSFTNVANSNTVLAGNKPLFDSVSESAITSLRQLSETFSSTTPAIDTSLDNKRNSVLSQRSQFSRVINDIATACTPSSSSNRDNVSMSNNDTLLSVPVSGIIEPCRHP